MSAPRPSIPFYLLLLLVAGLVLSWWLAAWHLPPAEDATMLFRYSENLVDTGRISYNPGGPRAEGATDFLWMLAIAGGYALGLSSFQAALLLSLGGLLGTLWVQYRLAQGSLGRLTLLWLGWLLASQLWAAAQGFSVLFWGFSLWLGIYFWEKKDWRGLYLSGLLMALIRPDGLLIAAPLALGSLWLHPGQRRANLRLLLRWAILPGLAYFAWRVWYFGQWWPLPFLVKTVATPDRVGFLVPGSLRYLLIYGLRYLGPLLLIVALGHRHLRQDRTAWVWLLSYLLLPSLLYLSSTLEQNVANRLVLPLLVGALALANRYWRPHWGNRLSLALFLLLSLAYCGTYGLRALETRTRQIRSLAQQLHPISGHRMAITEAGHLAYYSGWTALDLWGLNSPETARQVADDSLLGAFDPHLIVFQPDQIHPDSMMMDLARSYPITKTWNHMVFSVLKFSQQSGNYEIWRVPFALPPQPPFDVGDQLWLGGQKLLAAYDLWRGRAVTPYQQKDWYLLDVHAPAYGRIRQVLIQHQAYRYAAPGFPADSMRMLH